jgi:hypothetical protein
LIAVMINIIYIKIKHLFVNCGLVTLL